MNENGKNRTAVIASGCRTPIGKFLGALAPKTAPELGRSSSAFSLKWVSAK